uniref:Uncharacterized protein n=1 Tax=Anopheles atroparvus TaxID=41427 RepID=A0A182J301_ANOAO
MGFLDSYPIRKLLAFERKLAKHSDQFVLMRYLGILFAIRNDSTASVLGRTVWNCYRCVLLFNFGTFCYKVYWTLSTWDYSTSATSVLATALIVVGGLVRVLIFDRPVQIRLVRFLNDRSYRAHDQETVTSRLRLQRLNNRMMVLVFVSLLLEALWFLQSSLSMQPEFMLHYRGQKVGGPAVQKVYQCTTCCWTVIYIAVSVFIYMMLSVFRGEMAILVQSFANLGQCFERYPVDQDIALEATFYLELQNQLNVCIKRHAELLENLYEFFSTLAPFCFVQYYGTFMLLAICCAIVTFNGLSWILLVHFVFIGFLVLESFLLYRSIDILNELHLSIGTTLYNLNWNHGLRYSKRFALNYRNLRQSLLIVMLRAQTPFRLRVTGYGTFSINRFAELINSSYSMFTILRQFRTQTGSK